MKLINELHDMINDAKLLRVNLRYIKDFCSIVKHPRADEMETLLREIDALFGTDATTHDLQKLEEFLDTHYEQTEKIYSELSSQF